MCLIESRVPDDVCSSSSSSRQCFPQKRISLDVVGEKKKKSCRYCFSGCRTQDVIRTKCNLSVLIPQPNILTPSRAKCFGHPALFSSVNIVKSSGGSGGGGSHAGSAEEMAVKPSQINNPLCEPLLVLLVRHSAGLLVVAADKDGGEG